MVLVAQGRVITLVRPKKHSIHPSDLHILINTVQSSSSVNSSAAASWLPICLPKFNPAAFVNAYVTFLRRKDDDTITATQTPTLPSTESSSGPTLAQEPDVPTSSGSCIRASPQESERQEGNTRPTSPEALHRSNTAASITSAASLSTPQIEVGLICVSGLGDFDGVRNWCSAVAEVRALT